MPPYYLDVLFCIVNIYHVTVSVLPSYPAPPILMQLIAMFNVAVYVFSFCWLPLTLCVCLFLFRLAIVFVVCLLFSVRTGAHAKMTKCLNKIPQQCVKLPCTLCCLLYKEKKSNFFCTHCYSPSTFIMIFMLSVFSDVHAIRKHSASADLICEF